MSKEQHLEPEIDAATTPVVVRVRLAGEVTIDLFANAALRWLCRRDRARVTRIVGVVR